MNVVESGDCKKLAYPDSIVVGTTKTDILLSKSTKGILYREK
jgi:hypothetical protein